MKIYRDDSKVWTKEYNLADELIIETGEKDEEGNYVYDNLEGYKYVDVKFDTYKYVRKTLKGAKGKGIGKDIRFVDIYNLIMIRRDYAKCINRVACCQKSN